jgi:hypothetical protein
MRRFGDRCKVYSLEENTQVRMVSGSGHAHGSDDRLIPKAV